MASIQHPTRISTGIRFTALLVFLLPAKLNAGIPNRGEGQIVKSRTARNVWKQVDPNQIAVFDEPAFRPTNFMTFEVNEAVLDAALAQAPRRFTPAAAAGGANVQAPVSDGSVQRFAVYEDPVLSEAFAAQYPDIKTYWGRGVDEPTATIGILRSPTTFQAIILSERGAEYVQPFQAGDSAHYISFTQQDLEQELPDEEAFNPNNLSEPDVESFLLPPVGGSNGMIRTLRFAVNTTREWTNTFTDNSARMTALAALIMRVNTVWQRELGIKLELVYSKFWNNSDQGYPFDTPASDANMRAQNQTALAMAGLTDYDIGHALNKKGVFGACNGVADLSQVCGMNKGKGFTNTFDPSSAGCDRVFLHEVGHMLGAQHTYSNCTVEGGHTRSSAYEPGGGSTIMASPSVCSPGPLCDTPEASGSNLYYHTKSQEQIIAKINSFLPSATCAPIQTASTAVPTVTAGANFSIPKSTPFKLTAVGSDPNMDGLTYCWEQYDQLDCSCPPCLPATGCSVPAAPAATNTIGPLFASYPPTTSPTRYVPALDLLPMGSVVDCAVLPSVPRDLNFRVTVRDGNGGVAWDTMPVTLTVTNDPPLTVNTIPSSVDCSNPLLVAWTGGIPANQIKILYSGNNGASFEDITPGGA